MSAWVRNVCLVAVACTSFSAAAQVVTAKVGGGQIEGVAANGVVAFKGIPFSATCAGRSRSPSPRGRA